MYIAQEVLKCELWAAALKKLTTTFGKWRITMGQGRRGIIEENLQAM